MASRRDVLFLSMEKVLEGDFPLISLFSTRVQIMWDLKGKNLLRKAFKQSVSISVIFS